MPDESSDQKQLTFGEKAVGLSFNPSNVPKVDELKKAAAAFIDLCNDARTASDDPEVKRMYAVAITETQTAQMWAVKAATWNLGKTTSVTNNGMPITNGTDTSDPLNQGSKPDTDNTQDNAA